MLKKSYRSADLSRREVLQWIAASAVLGGLLPWRSLHAAGVLAQDAGIVRMKGKVNVNGKPASVGQLVKLGDQIETMQDAEVVFVVGKDAYLQRGGSRIRLENASGKSAAQVLRLFSGRVLAVFAKGDSQIKTPTVTLGIRGTGVYVEADPDKTYVCLCYGSADYTPSAQPEHTISQTTTYHDKPLWIYADPNKEIMAAAPPINHTDAELTMLEALVGRLPPFAGMEGIKHHGY